MGGTAELYSQAAIERVAAYEQEVRERQLHDFFPPGSSSTAQTFYELPTADEVIASPLFGAWLDGIIRASNAYRSDQSPEREAALHRSIYYLGNYTLAAAMGTKDITIRVATEENGVMIPGYGRAMLPPSEDASVLARVLDTHIIFRSPSSGHMTLLSKDTVRDGATEMWEPLRGFWIGDRKIGIDDLDSYRDIFRYPPSGRLTEAAYFSFATTIIEALDFMQAHAPNVSSAVRAILTTIVPAPPEPYPFGKCMAAGAAFGVLGLNQNTDPERLAAQIAFGIGKAVYMAQRGLYPEMYRPEDDPLSLKPVYPPSQEGYATAAHLQDGLLLCALPLAYFTNLALSYDPRLKAYGQLSFARLYTEAQQNLAALEASGYVYEGNRSFIAAAKEDLAAQALLFESMPDCAKQAVARDRHDHRLSWRLQMITPDPQAMTLLCQAWRDGKNCPPTTIPAELSDNTDAYTHTGQRKRYVLTETRVKDPFIFEALAAGRYDHPELFGNPNAGDIAFVLNDVKAARDYFREAIRQQPTSNEAWAGFALTFLHEQSAAQVIIRQPEVVKAFYLALGDPTVEPEAAAGWLASSSVANLFQDSWPA